LSYEEPVLEVAPAWSGLMAVLMARGAEKRLGIELVFDNARIEPQRSPLLGKGFWGEAYIDTGSRSARSLSGAEEGFVLKTSVLLRYWDPGAGLEERILYPYSEGTPSFLLVRGDDRKRQASLYVAELAMVLSILEGASLPIEPGERLLIVRHGSLLQSLSAYFNKVFDLDKRTAEAVLRYTGLDKNTARDLVDQATVIRGVAERVNPGILAALILDRIKRLVEQENHSVIGLTEDVSVGRHLLVHVMAESLIAMVYGESGSKRIRPHDIIDEGYYTAPRDYRNECTSDLSPASAPFGSSLLYELAQYLGSVVAKEVLGTDDREQAAIQIEKLGYDGLVQRIYERQALKLLAVPSDSHFILLYNYLYVDKNPKPNLTIEIDKSRLYSSRTRLSYNKRIGEESSASRFSSDEIVNMTSGVKLRYLLTETPPSCTEITREAARLGLDRRVLAEMIRVVPPVRVEYFSTDQNIWDVLSHVLAQSLVTTYGVPPQLLVVDSRSRVNEWEYSALASMLEELSRRVAPYSTFIRDFSTRTRHLL